MTITAVRSLSDHKRKEAFSRIESLYKAKRSRNGIPEYLATPKGMFAASPAREVFNLFTRMELQKYSSFCDLGSGDGMVTHLASLFTRAHGLEADPSLVDIARDMARDLGLDTRATFSVGDYLERDLFGFDVLYIYPDIPRLNGLELKLRDTFRGILTVYGPHFEPKNLAKLKEYQLDRGRAVVYTCENQ